MNDPYCVFDTYDDTLGLDQACDDCGLLLVRGSDEGWWVSFSLYAQAVVRDAKDTAAAGLVSSLGTVQ